MKILVVYQYLDSFVKQDIDILRDKHDVEAIRIESNYSRVLTTLVDLWKGVIWCDVSFSWFGKLNAFFAVLFSKILHKKSIVVAGGDDVAYVPEIKYGMFSFWWKKWCPLFVFKFVDMIFPVSRYTAEATINNAKADPMKIKTIYHGFDFNKFHRNTTANKKNLVLTVGNISCETLVVKGLKLFVESAKHLPDINFLLIGVHLNDSLSLLKQIAPPNVQIMNWLNQEELIEFYGMAKAYVQLSLHESFCCALAEAMLCECIPVTSIKGAIPEVVGDTGVYVEELTPKSIAEKIKYALSLPDEYGKKARNRIVEKFPLCRRKQQIIELIEKL